MIEPDAVVLGVGSPLMGDDGLGVSAVELARGRWPGAPGLAFLDGGTWGMRVLPHIECADRLLIIDAIKAGEDPGAVVRLEGEQIPRYLRHKLSPHQIELGEVLAVAELRGTLPSATVALGIEPAVIELHDGLSDTVRAALPALLDAIDAQLETWGYRRPEPARTGDGPDPGAVAGGGRAGRETADA